MNKIDSSRGLLGFFRKKGRPTEQGAMAETTAKVDLVADDISKINRHLRRLSIGNDQQMELLAQMNKKLSDIEQENLQRVLATREKASGVSLLEPDLVACLDDLEKLIFAASEQGLVTDVLLGIKGRLLHASGWTAAARIGEKPDVSKQKVADVLPDVMHPIGAVSRILRQGYLRADGSLLRDALVVIAGGNPPGASVKSGAEL